METVSAASDTAAMGGAFLSTLTVLFSVQWHTSVLRRNPCRRHRINRLRACQPPGGEPSPVPKALAGSIKSYQQSRANSWHAAVLPLSAAVAQPWMPSGRGIRSPSGSPTACLQGRFHHGPLVGASRRDVPFSPLGAPSRGGGSAEAIPHRSADSPEPFRWAPPGVLGHREERRLRHPGGQAQGRQPGEGSPERMGGPAAETRSQEAPHQHCHREPERSPKSREGHLGGIG